MAYLGLRILDNVPLVKNAVVEGHLFQVLRVVSRNVVPGPVRRGKKKKKEVWKGVPTIPIADNARDPPFL